MLAGPVAIVFVVALAPELTFLGLTLTGSWEATAGERRAAS